MIDYLYEAALRRGSGRTTRMLKGIIADAPNRVTVVANDRNHLEFMKKQFSQLGGDLNHVTFVISTNEMGFMGSVAVEYDHFTIERLFSEQREQIAQEIEAFGLLATPETTQGEIHMFSVMRQAAARIARGQK